MDRIVQAWGGGSSDFLGLGPHRTPTPQFGFGSLQRYLAPCSARTPSIFENQDLLTGFEKWQARAISSGTSWAAIGQERAVPNTSFRATLDTIVFVR